MAKIVGAACAGPTPPPPSNAPPPPVAAGGAGDGCVRRFFATDDDARAGVSDMARVSPFVASARAIELARLRMSSAAPRVPPPPGEAAAGFGSGAAESARGRSAAAGVTRPDVGGVRPAAVNDGARELNDELSEAPTEAEADDADGGGATAPLPRENEGLRDGVRDTDGVDGSEFAIEDVASEVGAYEVP